LDTSDGLLAPVYVFSASEQVNHNLLKIWSRKSGGDYFQIDKDFSAGKIVSNLGKPPYSFLIMVMVLELLIKYIMSWFVIPNLILD